MPSPFLAALRERSPDPDSRRWLFAPYDQLTADLGPLAHEDPDELGVVLVEAPSKAGRRPYHQQKLALVLANQRRFALELAERGVAVRYLVGDDPETPYRAVLEAQAAELGPLRVQRPAERELRVELAPLFDSGALEELPHEGWLTTADDFAALGDAPWRMDAFYRGVRKRTGILMEDGKPAGGKYSHDADNRERWDGDPPSPEPPRFEPGDVEHEVAALVGERFADHPGEVDLASLPTRAEDAERLWQHALDHCLEHFGPYEDAISSRSTTIFHTRVSPLVNLHRLLPRRVVDDVLALDLPLSSKEGFVRQVIGWRELVRHVHEATDGFRDVPGLGAVDEDRTGGADPSVLDAPLPLPPAFWGTASGLECLDRVVADVVREAWSHHITRLMVLSNVATLLGVRPRELTDWFWAMYVDAFDWVVEPNVLAMGTFAVGDVMTTKPYVSGAPYLHRMGDACDACRFHPKKTCPLTPLYWSFLERNRGVLEGNPRLRLPLASAAKRGPEVRERDAAVLEWVRDALGAGEVLDPADAP